MAIFWPKPWVNPSAKNLNFSTFWTCCFYRLERRFCVLEYCKTHFPALYCKKKDMEKWPFFDQNHGLTPLEKSHFFDFLNLLHLCFWVRWWQTMSIYYCIYLFILFFDEGNRYVLTMQIWTIIEWGFAMTEIIRVLVSVISLGLQLGWEHLSVPWLFEILENNRI